MVLDTYETQPKTYSGANDEDRFASATKCMNRAWHLENRKHNRPIELIDFLSEWNFRRRGLGAGGKHVHGSPHVQREGARHIAHPPS